MKLLHFPMITALLAIAAPLLAQDPPSFGAFQFSNGVHPTVDATFEGTDQRTVERYWRDELKAISLKTSNKKELTGEAARIPSASPDTLRIMVGVERPKGSIYTTAHLAFLTTAGYVGPDSPDRERNACSEWVQQRTLVLRRQLAQAEVDRQQKLLDNLKRDLDMLRRDQQRAEDNIRRSQQRIDQSVKDSTEASQQLAAPAVAAAGTDSTAQAAATKQHAKEMAKWEDRRKRAGRTHTAMAKRIQDLQWSLKKNSGDQAAKQQQITAQEAAVKSAQEKLQAIR